jgi:hypothetical protein
MDHEVDDESDGVILFATLYKNIVLTLSEETRQTKDSPQLERKDGTLPLL